MLCPERHRGEVGEGKLLAEKLPAREVTRNVLKLHLHLDRPRAPHLARAQRLLRQHAALGEHRARALRARRREAVEARRDVRHRVARDARRHQLVELVGEVGVASHVRLLHAHAACLPACRLLTRPAECVRSRAILWRRPLSGMNASRLCCPERTRARGGKLHQRGKAMRSDVNEGDEEVGKRERAGGGGVPLARRGRSARRDGREDLVEALGRVLGARNARGRAQRLELRQVEPPNARCLLFALRRRTPIANGAGGAMRWTSVEGRGARRTWHSKVRKTACRQPAL